MVSKLRLLKLLAFITDFGIMLLVLPILTYILHMSIIAVTTRNLDVLVGSGLVKFLAINKCHVMFAVVGVLLIVRMFLPGSDRLMDAICALASFAIAAIIYSYYAGVDSVLRGGYANLIYVALFALLLIFAFGIPSTTVSNIETGGVLAADLAFLVYVAALKYYAGWVIVGATYTIVLFLLAVTAAFISLMKLLSLVKPGTNLMGIVLFSGIAVALALGYVKTPVLAVATAAAIVGLYTAITIGDLAEVVYYTSAGATAERKEAEKVMLKSEVVEEYVVFEEVFK